MMDKTSYFKVSFLLAVVVLIVIMGYLFIPRNYRTTITPITKENFITQAAEHEYSWIYQNVYEIYSYASASYSPLRWQYGFYEFNDIAIAISYFDEWKSTAIRVYNRVGRVARGDNWERVSYVTGDRCLIMIRVENTVIIANAPREYRGEINNFLKVIGYLN